MYIYIYISNALRAIPATALAAKKSNLKSCQNCPKWFSNLSMRLLEMVLGTSWEASGRGWGSIWFQDGFKIPKVKVLNFSPFWKPKSIKNRFKGYPKDDIFFKCFCGSIFASFGANMRASWANLRQFEANSN